MSKTSTPSFVLTLKLNTSKKDNKILNDKFFQGFLMYKKLVRHARKELSGIRQNKEYRTLMDQYMKIKDNTDPESKQERNRIGKELSRIRMKFGLSEYQFHSWIVVQKNKSEGIDIHTAQKIASSVWQSVESILFRKGKTIHFKKFDHFLSMEGKSNNSGIRFKNGRLYWSNELCIQPQIRKNDIYAKEALTHKVKYCRIIRKPMGLKYNYYLQLILEGYPPEKHKFLDSGSVGLDQGVSTEAAVSENGCILEGLASDCKDIEKSVSKFQRKLDRSRRQTNPLCYNKNGTIKKGARFKYSKNYKKNQMRLKTVYRKAKDRAKHSEECLANRILCELGSDIITEPMNYKTLQKKSKETSVSEKTGRFKSKKRFGKSISKHSPSRFKSILSRKLSYIGKEIYFVDQFSYKASQYDHISDTYEKQNLNARSKMIDTFHVQRDLYSAFLLMCAKDKYEPDMELCTKRFSKFLENQTKCIISLLNEDKNYPSCMGLNDFKYLLD